MRRFFSVILACIVCQFCKAQNAAVDSLFKDITEIGQQYLLLKNEREPQKIFQISQKMAATNAHIQSSEITGLDSTLYNIHQFSSYLDYYSEFLNNPINLPDSLKPARVFAQLDSVAQILLLFDTLSYEIDTLEEFYFSNQEEFIVVKDNISEMSLGKEQKNLSGIVNKSTDKIVALSKMAGMRCCKIRIKVRVRIVVNPKKTYDRVVNTLEDAVNRVGQLIPNEVKKLGVEIFAASLEVEGNYIHFMNDLNQKVFTLSFSAFDFLRTLQENTDKEIFNSVSNLMNTAGMEMPSEIESMFDKLIVARGDIIRETMTGFSKAMELEFKIKDFSGDALKLFSKYLLLAGTEFPSMLKRSKLSINNADAYFQLNETVLQKAITKLFAHNIDIDSTKYKGFKLLINGSEHSVSFDEETGSIIIEVGDFNVKGIYLLGGMADLFAPSATINIKKAKIQLVPEISKDAPNTINLRPRLYFLDVKGSMPLFDRLTAWAIEKNFLENKIIPLGLDSVMNDQLQFKGSLPSVVPVKYGYLTDFLIKDKNLVVAVNTSLKEDGKLIQTFSSGKGFALDLSDHLLDNILKNALKDEGIRFSLKKDTGALDVFDPTYNYLHFKELNEIKIFEDKIFIDLKTQIHLRRFLGKKPKLNFEVTHAAFYITPVLGKNKKGESVIKLSIIPDIYKIQLSNLNKRLTRKVLKLFKQDKKPIRLSEINVESLQMIQFENPFKKNENLLDRFNNLTLKLQNGRMMLSVE